MWDTNWVNHSHSRHSSFPKSRYPSIHSRHPSFIHLVIASILFFHPSSIFSFHFSLPLGAISSIKERRMFNLGLPEDRMSFKKKQFQLPPRGSWNSAHLSAGVKKRAVSFWQLSDCLGNQHENDSISPLTSPSFALRIHQRDSQCFILGRNARHVCGETERVVLWWMHIQKESDEGNSLKN